MKRLYLNGGGRGKACLPLPCVEGAKSQGIVGGGSEG